MPEHLRRKHQTMRLPAWIVNLLDAMPCGKADAVIEALKRAYHWKEPKQ